VNITEILQLPGIRQDLSRFEKHLVDVLTGNGDFIDKVSQHLVAAGGKRLRPLLCITSAKSAADIKETSDRVMLSAVAVELVHLASLYHDDVMDEAMTRRNVETVNSRWGNLVAIVAGDFLLAKSAEIAARLGADIAELLAKTLGELCNGQLTEVTTAFNIERSEEEYFESISGKTAALMSASSQIGALSIGVAEEYTSALCRFGKEFGMAFQIKDDILDIIGDENQTGKAACQDLKEGVYTLPVIIAIKTKPYGDKLIQFLSKPFDGQRSGEIRDLIVESGAISYSIDIAREYLKTASENLDELPSNIYVESLKNLSQTYIQDLTSLTR
jgi:heptaprenyl diphosphate synthase